MSQFCETCGAEIVFRQWSGHPYCADCSDVEDLVHEGGADLSFLRLTAWLERVIDRRVQKALAVAVKECGHPPNPPDDVDERGTPYASCFQCFIEELDKASAILKRANEVRQRNGDRWGGPPYSYEELPGSASPGPRKEE